MDDPGAEEEVRQEADALARDLRDWETRLREKTRPEEETRTQGPAILTIQAGAGGTDAQDWAQQLAGMYAAWAEKTGRPLETLSVQHAPGGGLRGSTIEIGGPDAFRLLRYEHGTHRISHLSPRDQSGRRHTSFASVEVLPAPEPDQQTRLDMRDVRVETFGAGGPGGQHMQKSATAVRATHLPTGVTSVCRSERSQTQNRQAALRVLAARLDAREREAKLRERQQARGPRQTPSFGNRIRSYVFLPKRYVLDHRTGHRHPNPQAVLDGDLCGFLQAHGGPDERPA